MSLISVSFVGIFFILINLFTQTAYAHNEAGCNAGNVGSSCYRFDENNYCCGVGYCNIQWTGQCFEWYDSLNDETHYHCSADNILDPSYLHASCASQCGCSPQPPPPPPPACVGNVGAECGTYGCCSTNNVESECYNVIQCDGSCSYGGIRNEGAYCGNGACSCNETSSTCPADCPANSHKVCSGSSCVEVSGPGTNTCDFDWQCTSTHDECVSNTCQQVPGTGSSTCSPVGSSCTPPPPPPTGPPPPPPPPPPSSACQACGVMCTLGGGPGTICAVDPVTGSSQCNPQAAFSSQCGTGLWGQYYISSGVSQTPDAGELRKQEIDPIPPKVGIDYYSEHGPFGTCATGYFIRWSGGVMIPQSGTYTFYVEHSDGARLWVNDLQNPIMNWWGGTCSDPEICALDSASFTSPGPGWYPIKLEYYKQGEGTGTQAGTLKLAYAGPGLSTADQVNFIPGPNGDIIDPSHVIPAKNLATDVNVCKPPTGTITITTQPTDGKSITVQKGTTVNFLPVANSSGGNLRGFEIYYSRTTSQAWTLLTQQNCSGFSCNNIISLDTNTLPSVADYYVVINVYKNDPADPNPADFPTGNALTECSGNPFITFPYTGWSDCDPQTEHDSVTLHVTSPPSSAWIQTVGGDVHTNNNLNTTGGP